MYQHCPHGRRLGARIMGEEECRKCSDFPEKKLEDLRAIFAATFRLAFVGCRCFFCNSMPKGSKTGAKKTQILVLGRTTHLPTRIWRVCVCDQERTLPPTEQFHAHCLWSRADMAEAIREMDCCWDFFFFSAGRIARGPSPPKFWKLPLFFLRNCPIGRTAR